MVQVITDQGGLEFTRVAAKVQLILDPVLASARRASDKKAWLDVLTTKIDDALVTFQVKNGAL